MEKKDQWENTNRTGNLKDRIERAYRAAGKLTRERMRQEDPERERALREVESSDVVVVRGEYDGVELVFRSLAIPFTAVDPRDVETLQLRPEQLLVVNCPGKVGMKGIGKIRRFVRDGGSLFTTDWALRNVIEPAFPGVVEYNERPTRDTVVRIEIRSRDNPFLRGVLDTSDDPQWWLEGSSYPIRILDPERVEVLIASRELEEQWGEAAVAVTFGYGKGEVFHMISHYYLQRTELRSERHRSAAATYWTEKRVAMDAESAKLTRDLALGEVEAAASSSRWLANIVAEKKRRATSNRGPSN